jgi:uncharacterized protein YkwD
MTTSPSADRPLHPVRVFAALAAVTVIGAGKLAVAAEHDNAGYTADLARLINDYRAQHSLPALSPAPSLSDLAQAHAAAMAREDRLSHDGFKERLAKTHAPHCVENVGAGYGTARDEFEAWRNSAVHDRNLLDPRIRYMGLGIHRRYVTFFACG